LEKLTSVEAPSTWKNPAVKLWGTEVGGYCAGGWFHSPLQIVKRYQNVSTFTQEKTSESRTSCKTCPGGEDLSIPFAKG